jgi:hypothetical protein
MLIQADARTATSDTIWRRFVEVPAKASGYCLFVMPRFYENYRNRGYCYTALI